MIPKSFPPLPDFPAGEVWLAGAGPGDPRLLTVLALHAIGQADDIVYDALVDRRVLDLRRDGAELISAGKRGGRPSSQQGDINDVLIERARAGRRVLRLKGGDPYIFGRGGEEALSLARAQIPFRILPGVTSAFGALANAGIPATMRGFNKAIILATGHAVGLDDDLDWAALARTGQPIVVYMGLRNLPAIATALMSGGLAPSTPVAVIMAATTPVERVLVATLATVAERADAENFVSPSLIVVGDIVSMRAELTGIAVEAKSA